jgi:glycerophosphoryl diester phosphodiesterase
MKVIAHRGACTEALENSWTAFRLAAQMGADRIELDVHLTADNHIAILHDADLKRTAGIDKTLRQMTRADIKKSIRLSNGEELPFLDEVCDELLGNIEINVEIKSTGIEIVKAVGKLLANNPNSERIIISSFDKQTCADSAELFPNLKVALLWDKYLWAPGSFQFGPIRFMEKHKIRIYHPEAKLLTPQMMRIAKAKGIEVNPWVGLRDENNREQLWSYLMTVGVEGLCTNYPRQMKLWLEEAQDDESRFKNNPLMVHPSSKVPS